MVKMNFKTSFALLIIGLSLAPLTVKGECTEDENDGEFKKFFKKVSCNIQEGAEKIGEKSKPYLDSIRNETSKLADKAKPYLDSIENGAAKLADNAKQLGSDTVDKFNEWRGKVNEANNEPVPMNGELRTAAEAPKPSVDFAFPDESVTVKIDDRFLLDGGSHCKPGERDTGTGTPRCRKIIDS